MRYRMLIPPLFALPVLTACDSPRPTGPELDMAPLFASAASSSESPVLTFAAMNEVGTSRLIRTEQGISFQLRTALERGTTATVWVVIFNRPENCATSPCGEEDLFDPDVMADVVAGAGHVIGGSGQVGFAGHRREGDASGSIFAPLGLPSPGLIDARTAEIHLVIRSHGPVIPGMVREMISTFNGGCQNPGAPFPDPLPPALGAPGPNSCADVQFAMHLP